MGSPCQLQFYAHSEQQAHTVYNAVSARIAQLEQRYSRYRPDSLISQINQRAGSGIKTPIDPETVALLQYSEQCYQESGQLFDVTSGVLRRCWTLNRTELPTSTELEALVALINWPAVQWDEHCVYLPLSGMELDFGGLVKEYAADVAVSLCRQQGINAGIIELGGDVCVIGPLPNGLGWPVAIRDPRAPTQIAAQLTLHHGALASSGDYERFQRIGGISYSHILNPKTGWPVTGLRAVSVIAEQCIVAGSLATIAMLKANAGLDWLKRLPLAFWCCQQNGRIINRLKSVN